MANFFYAKLKGKKSGEFKGDVIRKAADGTDLTNWIECSMLEFAGVVPHDVISGAATGARRYSPVKIRKKIDGASPMIWQAMAQNDEITEAEFKFFRPATSHQKVGAGAEVHFFTIKLAGARITGVKMIQLDMHEMENAKVPMEEEVDFVFEKVEWHSEEKKTYAMDSWKG